MNVFDFSQFLKRMRTSLFHGQIRAMNDIISFIFNTLLVATAVNIAVLF